MNIVTYNPVSELERFFNTDKLFHPKWRDEFPHAQKEDSPRVNITETEDEYSLVAEVPGMSEGDVNLEVHNDVLKLTGKKEVTSDKDEEVYHIREFHHASFERSFKLGKEVDTDQVSAKLEDGVLKVSLPKKHEVKAKKIDIQKQVAINN